MRLSLRRDMRALDVERMTNIRFVFVPEFVSVLGSRIGLPFLPGFADFCGMKISEAF
jgi:hypothetical protein